MTRMSFFLYSASAGPILPDVVSLLSVMVSLLCFVKLSHGQTEEVSIGNCGFLIELPAKYARTQKDQREARCATAISCLNAGLRPDSVEELRTISVSGRLIIWLIDQRH